MKSTITALLLVCTRRILRKYHPLVIGITGSVGKTSTKDAVFSVLSRRFRVRRSQKNYNSEIGVPLTVIGATSPGKNPLGWLRVFLRALGLILFKQSYPDILILELGIDHPGDMRLLLETVQPKIGILTAIAPAHTQFFVSFDEYANEKRLLITSLPKDGLAVLNADLPEVRLAADQAKCPVVTCGVQTEADMRAVGMDIRLERPRGADGVVVAGISCKVSRDGQLIPLVLREAISPAALYSGLMAISVGTHLGMTILECVEGLDTYVPPPGRMRVVPGLKYTTIIDDTYNSSPLAALEALDVLRKIDIDADDRRIAVFGDMLELGTQSERLHQQVGEKVAATQLDLLITVGERSRDMARGAIARGFPKDKTMHFATSIEAGKYLQGIIKIGDVLLVKGSQGMRMEKIVKELMAEPLRAPFLLVRQDPPWI